MPSHPECEEAKWAVRLEPIGEIIAAQPFRINPEGCTHGEGDGRSAPPPGVELEAPDSSFSPGMPFACHSALSHWPRISTRGMFEARRFAAASDCWAERQSPRRALASAIPL